MSCLDARRAGTLLHRQPETDLAGTSREDAGGNGAAQYGRVRQVCRQQNALIEKSDADVGTKHPQGLSAELQATAPYRLVHRHQQPVRPADRPHREPALPLHRGEAQY